MQTATPISIRVDADLRGPRLTPETWREVAAQGGTWTVFQEPHWQQSWWDSYGRGELLVVSAEAGDRVVAIAPLFIDGGMAYFVGSGGSDYLDFIGDAAAPGVMEAMLAAVLERVPGLLGFLFYHVPESSRTADRLRVAAERHNLDCVGEGEMAAPLLELGPGGAAGLAAANKKSLVRHDRGLRRQGTLAVRHAREAAEILPRLETFFDQHARRWNVTAHPSLFVDPLHRAFYRRLAEGADTAGWLRFTSIELDGRPVAFHFGFSHRGSYLWYKPSFEIELARLSPGEVLLRELLLAAVQEGAAVFDFGLGEEPFKLRFANRVPRVRNWGLYPRN